MKYRLVFFGTSDFSVPSLEALIQSDDFDVVGVVTKIDALIGRKQVLTSPIIKKIAEKNNIPVLQPRKLKEVNFQDKLRSWKADVFVVVSYGKILPSSVLGIPKYGVINVHGSLLPRWRGASCVQSAIVNGDLETGITIMEMDEKMDHGAIIAQFKVKIPSYITGGELHDELALLGGKVLPDVLKKYLNKEIIPHEQDESQVTFCKLLSRSDGEIDWTKTKKELIDFVRGFNPWPGTWTQYQGQRVKIFKLQDCEVKKEFEVKNNSIGEWMILDNKLCVKALDGWLQILELQFAGHKKITGKQYLSGLQGKINN